MGGNELFTLMLEELHQLPTDQAKAVECFVQRRWLQSSIPGTYCRSDDEDSGTDGASPTNPTGEVGGVDELFTLMLEELHQLPTDQAKAVESFVQRRWLQSSIQGTYCRRHVSIESRANRFFAMGKEWLRVLALGALFD